MLIVKINNFENNNIFLAMRKILILLFTMSSGILSAQTYIKPNNTYGVIHNRIKPDTVLHLPVFDTTLLRTTDTSAQIRVLPSDGLLYYRYGGRWRNVAGGSIPTWQQTLNTSSQLAGDNYIDGGDGIFSINNTSRFKLEANRQGSNLAGITADVNDPLTLYYNMYGDSTIIQTMDYGTGWPMYRRWHPGVYEYRLFYPVDYNNIDDTVATQRYARSAGIDEVLTRDPNLYGNRIININGGRFSILGDINYTSSTLVTDVDTFNVNTDRFKINSGSEKKIWIGATIDAEPFVDTALQYEVQSGEIGAMIGSSAAASPIIKLYNIPNGSTTEIGSNNLTQTDGNGFTLISYGGSSNIRRYFNDGPHTTNDVIDIPDIDLHDTLMTNGTARAMGLMGGGASGTVTSVGLSMPSGFSISGSPVTSSGTINVTTTLNGYVKADGSGFSAVSTLPATDLSGTIPDARLSNNVGYTISHAIGAGVSTAASSTEFMINGPTGASVTEGIRQVPVPVAGMIRQFYVYTSTAQPSTGSYVLTIRRNNSSTSTTITLAASAAAGVYSTSTTTALSAGDLLSIQFVNNATGASATIRGFSIFISAN